MTSPRVIPAACDRREFMSACALAAISLALGGCASLVVRRVTPPGAPAMAAGFSTDGRLFYDTAKGQQLNVWALPGVPPAGGRSTTEFVADR